MSYTDPRGVLRGACTSCACKQYEYDPESKRAACSYCDCPAPKHKEEMVQSDPSVSAISNESNANLSSFNLSSPNSSASNLSSSNNTKNTSMEPIVVINVPSDTPGNILELLERNSRTSDTEIPTDEIPIPEVFPDAIEESLKAKSVTEDQVNVIVHRVVSHVVGKKIKGKNCTIAGKCARRISNKYSPLKKRDPHLVGLKKKFMRRLSKEKTSVGKGRPSRESESQESQEPEVLDHSKAQLKMKDDWRSGSRCIDIFRMYMEVTRTKRREEVARTSAVNLLRRYPALRMEELMLEECISVLKIKLSFTDMVAKWRFFLPNIIQYLNINCDSNISSELSLNHKTRLVLKDIHLAMTTTTKTNKLDPARKVLEVFPGTEPINENRPKTNDPPRLQFYGNLASDSSIICYVDLEPMFSTTDPEKALILLLATYYNLNVNFNGPCRQAMIALSCAVLSVENVDVEFTSNGRFVKRLKQIGITGL